MGDWSANDKGLYVFTYEELYSQNVDLENDELKIEYTDPVGGDFEDIYKLENIEYLGSQQTRAIITGGSARFKIIDIKQSSYISVFKNS